MLPFVDKTILVRLRTLCFSDIIEKNIWKERERWNGNRIRNILTIDSEKCFLSERQEGEEKAIMKNLRLKKVSIKDLDQIRALYWRLLDSSPKYGQILQWKKNIYPNDDDWNSYIVKGEMYLILKDTDVIGAVAVTNAQSKEYRKIHWKVKADDQDAAVVHLLMILPEYQGDGAATVALDEIIKLAADKKKKAVRLDAIGTNVPAQKLYEKYGFVNCGTAQEYYESTGETEFVFYEYVLVE